MLKGKNVEYIMHVLNRKKSQKYTSCVATYSYCNSTTLQSIQKPYFHICTRCCTHNKRLYFILQPFTKHVKNMYLKRS